MPRSLDFARRAGPSGGGALRSVRRGRAWVPRAALWTAALVVLAGVALVQFGDSGVPAWRRLRAQDAELSREVDELVRRNERIRSDLQALQDDPETLERLAREKAGMKRPEEAVLKVLPADAATQQAGN
jgi:cell division protein FtsB